MNQPKILFIPEPNLIILTNVSFCPFAIKDINIQLEEKNMFDSSIHFLKIYSYLLY